MKVEKIKIEEDYHPYYHHIVTKTKNKIANIPNKTVVLIVIINKKEDNIT